MKKNRKLKRILAVGMALVMALSLLPTAAFAAEGDVTYTKTTTVAANEEYLIVAESSSGSTYALANDSNIKLSVTPSGNSITLSASNAAKATWTTAAATGDALEKDALTFTNNGQTLNRNGSANAVGFGTSIDSARYGMSYTSGTLCNLSSNDTPYYLGYGSSGSGSSYTFRFATSATNNISLYVKDSGEGGGQENPPAPPAGGTVVSLTPSTSKPSENVTINVGDTFTVKVTNASTSQNYTYTISSSTSGIAKLSTTSVAISSGQTGEFTVQGLAAGTTTIKVTNGNTYSERIATINLTVNGEGGQENPPAPPAGGTVVPLTPSTDKPSADVTINVGDTFTARLTNASTNSAYTFNTTFSKSGIAQVNGATSFEIGKGATQDVQIEGLAAGTTTITFTNENSYGSQYNRVATINLTVKGEGGQDTPTSDVVYTMTNQFKMGETYLIVTTDNGAGVALTKNGSSSSTSGFSTTNVTVSDGKITVSNALTSAEWTAKPTTNGSSLIGLYNGNNVLKVDASNSNSPYIHTGDTSYNAGGFGYTGNNHVSYPYGQNPKDYFIGSNGNSFKASNTESGLDNVYIFVKGEGGQVTPQPTGDATYVAFTSDVHNQSGDASSTRLNSWINTVTGIVGSNFENFGFCGDMGPASGQSSAFWTNAQKVMDVVANSSYVDENGFYVCGNHEYNPGNYTHSANATTQKYSDAGTYFEGSDYIFYSLGARQYDEIYHDEDIAAMSEFLDEHSDYDGPIFILTHFPLHKYSGGWGGYGGSSSGGESSTVHDGNPAIGSAKIIAALNEAVEENGQTIIFLWGHNHSSSNDHYDAIYNDINGTAINFTYAAAGCMSDSEYGQSANVHGKGLVAAIYDDCLTLTYYGANGAVVGTPATIALDRGDTPTPDDTYYTISASAGANGSISPAGDKTVKEGKSQTYTFAPNAGYEVASVTVDGQAVTVSGNSYTFANVAANHSISVTFTKAAETVFDLATEVGAGNYVLVSNGYALFNNNGKISAVPVTVSGNQVSLKNSDVAGATWTLAAATGTDKSGDYTITNNGYYFTRVSDASGSSLAADITTSPISSSASGLPYYQWTYDVANGRLSHIGGQDMSATFYAYYNTSANAFYTTTDAQSLKLYVVSNDQPAVVEVTSVSLDATTADLTVGDDQTLTATVLPADASDKTVTWTSSDPSVATVDQNGKITAVGAGIAVITAQAGNETATCTVTVAPAVVEVSSVSLDATTADLTVGDDQTLTATVLPADASDKTVTWTSSNPAVATVDQNGKITAVGAGTAVITAQAGDETATCTVTVEAASSECPKDATCPLSKFVDLTPTAWYHDGIHFCLENGLMSGTGADTFGPTTSTSRGMIVTILYNLAGKPAVTADNIFPDVASGFYYEQPIAWAYENGIVAGYSDGNFGPNDPITREQMAAILYKFADYMGIDTSAADDYILDFSDVNAVSSYAVPGIRWCVMNGIMSGKGEQLDPSGLALRQEAACMIYQLANTLNGANAPV